VLVVSVWKRVRRVDAWPVRYETDDLDRSGLSPVRRERPRTF
jgi:hypothetical protein